VTFATIDHSDIRGLATALHLFFARLPRSSNGGHPGVTHVKLVEDSSPRSPALSCRSGVQQCGVVSARWHFRYGLVAVGTLLARQFDMAPDIPNRTRQLANDGDADLVRLELLPQSQMASTSMRLACLLLVLVALT